MSRIASLTPTRSPSNLSNSHAHSPSSKTAGETTHHRMLKLLLSEVRQVNKQWDELVATDGLKAGKRIIDEGTEMEYVLHC